MIKKYNNNIMLVSIITSIVGIAIVLVIWIGRKICNNVHIGLHRVYPG